MAYLTAAPDPERLPWLKNEKKAAPKSEAPLLLTWGMAALAVVGGASYWLGMSGAPQPAQVAGDTRPSATVQLPEPQRAAPAPQVEIPAMPEVRPSPPPAEVRVAPRKRHRARKKKLGPMERDTALPAVVAAQQDEKATKAEPDAAEKPKAEAPQRKPVTYWPASESQGAYGRVVRIGTFSTRRQAKKAWWKVVKVYPGMKSLKAVVAPVPSYRNGRTYYRLQFGTTSQAHSEILCQRMRIVRVSCSVVGLPDRGA